MELKSGAEAHRDEARAKQSIEQEMVQLFQKFANAKAELEAARKQQSDGQQKMGVFQEKMKQIMEQKAGEMKKKQIEDHQLLQCSNQQIREMGKKLQKDA